MWWTSPRIDLSYTFVRFESLWSVFQLLSQKSYTLLGRYFFDAYCVFLTKITVMHTLHKKSSTAGKCETDHMWLLMGLIE